jgi:hypothetical protein
MKRTLIVISDNIEPRCGHYGTLKITYTSDRGQFTAVVECSRRDCRAAWVWGKR